MHPFKLTAGAEELTNVYLSSSALKNFFIKASDRERLGIIRLWITEGIPFVFKNNPILYEEVRSYIAYYLNISPKEVTIVGSARVGYSLTNKEWGREFIPSKSDLDFAIISNSLYNDLVKDFQQWVKDITLYETKPNSPDQMIRWLEAIKTVDNNIPKGYINVKQLYGTKKYKTVQKCKQTMYELKKKLEKTLNAPAIHDSSIRIYSNWAKCIKQLEINFKVALIWHQQEPKRANNTEPSSNSKLIGKKVG